MGRHQAERRPGLLREARRFRFLWLSRTISATGIGVSRVALVLLASPAGAGAVSLVLLASTLPQLLGPVAGAVADRVDQRRLLAGCECGQGLIFALLAVFRPPVPLLLPLVATAGLAATLFSPAGKSSVPRLVPADRLPRANALLGAAFNLQVMAGYGIVVAAYGTGMLGASLALAVLAERRTPRFWLAAGFATGAAGTVGTGLAGSIGLAAAAQAVAGAGNTADLVGNDTLIQQLVPPAMLGRVFGALATAAQAGAGIAYAAAAPVVALAGPRITFLIAGAGMVAGLLVLVPALRAASQRPGPDVTPPGTDPVSRPGGPAPAARR